MSEFKIPTNEEIAALDPTLRAEAAAAFLQSLEAGYQPFPLFRQLRRLVVMSTVELVPIHTSSEKLQVLVGQRPTGPEEPWWGGQLNLPGSVLLPNESLNDYHDLETPSDRILMTEFSGTVQRASKLHVFDRGLPTGESGRENKTWAWAEVTLVDGYDTPRGGEFYDAEEIVANPPETLVEGHAQTIRRGLQAYRIFQAALS